MTKSNRQWERSARYRSLTLGRAAATAAGDAGATRSTAAADGSAAAKARGTSPRRAGVPSRQMQTLRA